MKVSVVIPNFKRNIEQLKAGLSSEYEVLIIDDDNMTLSQKRNEGIRKSTGELIYFLDDDNLPRPGAIKELEVAMGDRRFGIIASVALAKDGQVVDGGAWRNLLSGFMLPVGNLTPGTYLVHEVANAFMVRREVLDMVGGFDEQRFPMDMDEADLCLRVRKAGWLIGYCPESIVYHEKVPKTPSFRRKRSAYYMGRNRILFQRRHLNNVGYVVFLAIFLPVFIAIYIVSLVLHGQWDFIPAFLKGVVDGLYNRTGVCKKY